MLGLHGDPTMSGMSGGAGGVFAGIAPDHLPALIAPLLVPVAIWLFLRGARVAAAAGFTPALRFERGYGRATLVQRLIAVLLLVTAGIHLGLVPGHAAEAPKLARLFAIDGLLFLIVALSIFTMRWWKPAAVVLLVLTLLAYISAIGRGQERADQLGIATKLVELMALGLVLLPDRQAMPTHRGMLRRMGAAAALVVATVISGAGIWGAELKADNAAAAVAPNADGAGSGPTGMFMLPVPARPPTPAERAAAARLAADTKTGIAKYEDVNAALADGYQPTTPPKQPLVHYGNRAFAHDGRTLDPARPEALVYASTAHGMVLMGAMYMTEKPWAAVPAQTGPLVQWHVHTGLCFSTSFGIAGFLSPFGACPAGSFNAPTPAMLHVWTVDGVPGPFGELDPAFVARIRRH